MDDDFNTASAISVLFEMVAAINRFMDEERWRPEIMTGRKSWPSGGRMPKRCVSLGKILGLFESRPPQSLAAMGWWAN